MYTTQGNDIEYKKVAVVENFFDIIYNVHVNEGARGIQHAGQKRTHRTVRSIGILFITTSINISNIIASEKNRASKIKLICPKNTAFESNVEEELLSLCKIFEIERRTKAYKT